MSRPGQAGPCGCLKQCRRQLAGARRLDATPLPAPRIGLPVTAVIHQCRLHILYVDASRNAWARSSSRRTSSRLTTSAANTRGSCRSSATGSNSPPPCRGATARCCSAIPTATSSTSSPRSPTTPSRISAAHPPSGCAWVGPLARPPWLSDFGQLERYFDDQRFVDAASPTGPDSPVHA